ncbi:RNA methyltransferase [Francisella philomiragia]|uniref:tRNA (cytidine/uridine-2'-O-)-methyltransferase TrmJ n=1 Tax=Francisella philomiragia subsp. philomiragia (strain ATCC 25017 / CCUG 19701 / FSC 153 / O\|nr:RNA methyltransferase [Francisella philomiragia]AJI46335.1 tRNA (cytidine/uridine-2'-O-)-methyltransferase TrmJ [Francisella philomiragia]AJI48593.1 tRNA (cytidine/uridine-2'-O-)-methyltransferase TrmJ [Francisella philomiragia]AJI74542.1 RNA methyltransferase, TrmH, group 1 family protein [Francisella philomiragia subsp. philomiragia ATCC 25015]EET21153.1 rRNA methyltransferase [Francisella philomiragia subsp. philomiragia ATCC 25015]MBK2019682.1 RNA methyltransferase [Francisella philomir
MNNLFDNIRIVLVEPSHSGNVGSTARAMLNMGLTNLWLVNPKKGIDDEAIALSCHATEVVKNARIVPNLQEALDDIDYVVGTSARVRRVSLPIEPISKVATNILNKIQKSDEKIAILFGRERTGLLNEELLMSNVHAYIPSNEGYTSLNLAQAVQLVAYEIYKQTVEISDLKEVPEYTHLHKKASVKELQGLYQHFEDSMLQSGFLDKDKPGHVMDKMRRLFQRSELESQEVNILRGFLTSLDNKGKLK